MTNKFTKAVDEFFAKWGKNKDGDECNIVMIGECNFDEQERWEIDHVSKECPDEIVN